MKKIKFFLKKYYWLLIIIVLLFPIRVLYQDGGSYSYNAILYKYFVWNPMPSTPFEVREKKIIFKLFPFNFHSDEYYLELKPNKSFAYIYDDQDEKKLKDFLECNIGTYSLVKKVDGEVLTKKETALSAFLQSYDQELDVEGNAIIHLANLSSKIKDLQVFKPNDNKLVTANISVYNSDLAALKLENVKEGKYIISFKTAWEENEVWYSFQINVV